MWYKKKRFCLTKFLFIFFFNLIPAPLYAIFFSYSSWKQIAYVIFLIPFYMTFFFFLSHIASFNTAWLSYQREHPPTDEEIQKNRLDLKRRLENAAKLEVIYLYTINHPPLKISPRYPPFHLCFISINSAWFSAYSIDSNSFFSKYYSLQSHLKN